MNRIKMPVNESSVESMNGEVEEIDLPSVKKAESCKTREKRLADLPQSCILEGKQYDSNRLSVLECNFLTETLNKLHNGFGGHTAFDYVENTNSTISQVFSLIKG